MRRDDELDRELQFHIDSRIGDLIAEGLTADEARRRARLELGGVMQTKEAVRDLGVWSLVNGLAQDCRLAFRSLRATPIVTAVAVLSLALGIGANTAIFSIVNSLMLRALPIKEPSRLVLVKDRESSPYPEWSYPVWLQIQQRRGLFDAVAAYSPTARANLTISGDTQKIDGLIASGSFFETLGVSAMLGRNFSDSDDQRNGGPDGPVAVISYRFWQRHFHGAADVIGKTLPLESVAFTVVGVMGPDFFGPDVGRTFDAIVPLGVEPLVSRRESLVNNPNATSWLNLVARLKPDQTNETTTAILRAQQAHIFEVTRPDWSGHALQDYLKQTFTLVPAATGGSTLRQIYQRPLVTILAVVAMVLLIACANIANLLLARATARRRELSVRLALGASRWRIARQLLTESVVLAAIGSVLGVAGASWGSRLLVHQLSTQTRTVFLDLSIDGHVLAFTIAVTAITALLFGVAPAVQVSNVAPMEALKERGENGRSADGHRSRLAAAMVVAQVALSLVLVVAAGLFLRTFAALATRDLGFERAHVLVATVNAHSAAIDPAHRLRIYGAARDAIRALPGVEDAALSAQTPPIDGATMIVGLKQVSGGEPLGDRPLGERTNVLGLVGPGFFNTFGTPIVAGRDFSALDQKGAPLVAVVNRAFAAQFLNGADPVGRTLETSSPALSMQIIGEAADAVYRSVRAPVQPVVYVPLTQATWAPTSMTAQVNLSVRTRSGPPELLARSAGAAVRSISPEIVVTITSLSTQLDESLTQERVVAILSGFFGALALLLAGLGLYGVTSYAVSRRRTENGIRIALGATRIEVIRLVLSRVTKLVGFGILAGTGASFWASTFVASLLYGLEPRDPVTLVAAACVLATVGAVAGWLPAQRASRLDPAEILRDS